ncbi:MAG: efflux RND transporter periplasmic adaptor subunit [Candidatus Latescibacteria bacterium]|jgi:RND family efflux transporter MFP subunit|nr:efflux RND transporter periplasmic adaptor subunit [Candidatus Latescibacterota bacterium]
MKKISILLLTMALLFACADSEEIANAPEQSEQLWTCGMHPHVLVSEAGQCPICKMDLVAVNMEQGATISSESVDQSGHIHEAAERTEQERNILYWRAPMDPTYVSDSPGKSPMGMDPVPVYDGEQGSTGPTVIIDPVTVQNIGVQFSPVRQESLQRIIRSVSHVDYNEETFSRVNIKYSGWIERLYVDQTGQPVKAGQPMLEIYSPELVSTQEEYLLAFRNRQRLGESDMPAIASGAISLLKAARRRLSYWDITDDQIRALENSGTVTKTMTIFAPSDGFVIEKHVEQGMRVAAGMDLYRLADLSSVWLYAHFYEHEGPWIRAGQEVVMDLPYNPGKEYRGTVDYVYPYLDKQTRDIKVRLVFPNPRLELKPNMYANVNLKIHMGDVVTVVKDDAVIRSGTRDMVFVALGDGKFEPREIVLGVKGDGGLFQVISGLSPGESVVTSAQFLLDSESRLKEAVQKMLASRRLKQSEVGDGAPTTIKPR